MHQNPGGGLLLFWATALLMLLLGIYVGTYYVLVRPVERVPFPTLAVYPPLVDYTPNWRGGEWNPSEKAYHRWSTVFGPVHEFDRRIRPRVWNP